MAHSQISLRGRSHEDVYKRVISPEDRAGYELLMGSGLYSDLARAGLLVPHTEEGPACSKLLVSEQVEFISYPYEWCFTQLKDAALLLIDVQKRALRRGMSLREASAFQVQFRMCEPLFTGTLSFERDDGGPWIAHEQFCRHFLGPLLLWWKWPKAVQHLRVEPEGLALETISQMLGWRTCLQAGPLKHIHLHARALQGHATKAALAESLRAAVERTEIPERAGRNDSAEAGSASFKQAFIRSVVRELRPQLAYDIGGGAGACARVVAAEGCQCVMYDSDPMCVDRAYREEKAAGNGLVLPLVMDVANPSPAAGFDLAERQSIFDRPRADLAMALGLLRDLRLRQGVPFARMAGFLSKLAPSVIVEYAALEDTRSVPEDYSHQGFVSAFSRHFRLNREARIPGADRWLFWFER